MVFWCDVDVEMLECEEDSEGGQFCFIMYRRDISIYVRVQQKYLFSFRCLFYVHYLHVINMALKHYHAKTTMVSEHCTLFVSCIRRTFINLYIKYTEHSLVSHNLLE